MNFEDAFPEVMKRGGFDAVVGNPPYVRIQGFDRTQVDYFTKNYRSAFKSYDIYVVFVERALSMLNRSGVLGYILPHKFFNAQYGEHLRGLMSDGRHVSKVIHFGDQQVFEGATTYTCLLFLSKAPRDNFSFSNVNHLERWRTYAEGLEITVEASTISSSEWNLAGGKSASLFEKLRSEPTKLDDFADRIAQGIRTSANEVYVLDLVSAGIKKIRAFSKILGREVVLDRDSISFFLQGREIKPFAITPSGKVVIIPYDVEDGSVKLIPEKIMSVKWPNTLKYLQENKAYLEKRERSRMKGRNWYAYIYPKNLELMRQSKILVPDIANRASFAFDSKGEFAFTSGYGITLKSTVQEAPEYVLALVNSRVLDFYLKRVSTTLRGGFLRYFAQFVEQLPVKAIDFSDSTDKSRHDHIVSLVERMLAAKEELSKAKTEAETTRLERECESLDRQIDQSVYELYGLTEEEIKVVEGK